MTLTWTFVSMIYFTLTFAPGVKQESGVVIFIFGYLIVPSSVVSKIIISPYFGEISNWPYFWVYF